MQRTLTRMLVGAAVGTLLQTPVFAQSTLTGTELWCKDATTICWADDEKTSKGFSGLRFVFEPQLGVLVQAGDNKFVNANFKSLEKVGVATNLWGSNLGLQSLFIYPSAIQFDEQSPVRVDGNLLDAENGKIDVEWGATIGITLVDGVLSTGWGFRKYDRRDFKNFSTLPDSTFRDSFFYFNVQAIEAVKGAIKAAKN